MLHGVMDETSVFLFIADDLQNTHNDSSRYMIGLKALHDYVYSYAKEPLDIKMRLPVTNCYIECT